MTADGYDLPGFLSILAQLDPFKTMGSGELGFSLIADILNSGYGERQREQMAGAVVKLLEEHFFPTNLGPFISIKATWIPPLLGFISLCEKLGATHPIPGTTGPPGIIALRFLTKNPESADSCPMLLPILCSTLLPTNYINARHLALTVFLRFRPGWFSPKMENIPSEDLNKLVQAVGDPFQFPNLPLRDIRPMMITAILIDFASSDLWRNHLRRSNFTSCEEILSTWDGQSTALRCIDIGSWPDFLCTAAKIIVAIGRLEELHCPNTAEFVIMWAWTVGFVNLVDHDCWELIGRETLRFYQTHGVERLAALKRRIADENMDFSQQRHLRSGLDTFVELPALKLQPEESRELTYVRLSQACQLRGLYQLFGYDLTTWEEAVAVGAGGKAEVSSRHSVALAPLMDWACDYP